MKRRLLALLLSISIILSGCSANDVTNNIQKTADIINSGNTGKSSNSKNKNLFNKSNSGSYSLSNIPEFSGSPYVEINNNVPFFSAKDKKRTDAFEKYSRLDSLGRCGVAYANVCKELQPTEERGYIGKVKPSGWHTVKYNGLVDGNYLYNRCHLIGYQLTGENANEKNLITGTRYMNCEGQLPFENEVDDYVDSTGNHVLYRVTPIFEGNNLVASGVLTEAYSVEDNGKGCQFCVFCYNVQPGIYINYATGESHINKDSKSSQSNTGNSQSATYNNHYKHNYTHDTKDTTDNNDSQKHTYIINKNTHKFHRSGCSSISQIRGKNRKEINCSRKSLIRQGYEPCKKCNP